MKTTQEMIAVMQAYCDGKRIEALYIGPYPGICCWGECTNDELKWDWKNFDYRIME